VGDLGAAAPTADAVCAALARRDVRAEARTLEAGGAVATQILEAAAGEKASLLVMGAYGHSRLRELVLGGVTRRVLLDADLPVLMAH